MLSLEIILSHRLKVHQNTIFSTTSYFAYWRAATTSEFIFQDISFVGRATADTSILPLK